MKRYDLIDRLDGYELKEANGELSETGYWVRFEDVEDTVAKIEELRKAVAFWDQCRADDTAFLVGAMNDAREWLLHAARELVK